MNKIHTQKHPVNVGYAAVGVGQEFWMTINGNEIGMVKCDNANARTASDGTMRPMLATETVTIFVE